MNRLKCLVIFFLLFLLTSCRLPAYTDSVYNSGRGDLFVPFSYTMPLSETGAEGQILFAILETDSYGRTLCRLDFSQYPNAFFLRGAAYAIVQCSTDTTTSFYEDYCCAGVVEGKDANAVILQLKEQNDWDQPLNPENMTTLPYEGLRASGLYEIDDYYQDYKEPALNALGLDSYGSYFDFICRDSYGRTLVSISYPKQNVVYLAMMMDKSLLPGQASSCCISDLSAPFEMIHTFKEANHWNQPIS